MNGVTYIGMLMQFAARKPWLKAKG